MKKIQLTIFMIIASALVSLAQENIVTGLKNKMKRADAFYSDFYFQEALELYLSIYPDELENTELQLKIAKTYVKLNNSTEAVTWYQRVAEKGHILPSKDMLRYAMALTQERRHADAARVYNNYLQYHESNEEVTQKVFANQQAHHFYRDSSGYLVNRVTINSDKSDFSPVFFNNGIVFVSGLKTSASIKRKNAFSEDSYLRLYYSPFQQNANSTQRKTLGKAVPFKVGNFGELHEGPICFSPDSNTVYLTRNTSKTIKGQAEEIVLGIFVSHRNGNDWSKPTPFFLNSATYSVGHPTLSQDGNTLYFISNMPGGLGGTDIYKIEKEGGQWSKPVNLGAKINTSSNEMFPFIHRNFDLYFASEGHAGLGGLDIFKTTISGNVVDTVRNLGYPVNSPKDDFSLVLDPMGVSGYFSSNRAQSGLDDDIYNLHIRNNHLLDFKLFVIKGTVNEYPSAFEQNNPSPVAEATVMVVDAETLDVIGKAKSDEKGNFLIKVPYSGNLMLMVSKEEVGTHHSSLFIPDNQAFESEFQINFFKDQNLETQPENGGITLKQN